MKSKTVNVIKALCCVAFAWSLMMSAADSLLSQSPAQAKAGKMERIKVHGKSLEGNLQGESADPDVSIYLPPGYDTDRNRRYPVVG